MGCHGKTWGTSALGVHALTPLSSIITKQVEAQDRARLYLVVLRGPQHLDRLSGLALLQQVIAPLRLSKLFSGNGLAFLSLIFEPRICARPLHASVIHHIRPFGAGRAVREHLPPTF
jgi:hypothetical protein